MFINIIHFPPIKDGQEEAFLEWFTWSNELYARHTGFISRRLLKLRDGGHFVGIVEHASYETFMAMHTSSTQAEANKAVTPYFDGHPTPEFYEVILE